MAAIALTWYSQQNYSTFPFGDQKIVLLVYQQRVSLLFKHKFPEKSYYTIFTPNKPTFCHPQFPHNSTWHLISPATFFDTLCNTSMPTTWTVDNIKPSKSIAEWPLPSKTSLVNYSKNIQYSFNSFNALNNVMLYTIDSISFLFIGDTSTNIDNSFLLKYSEKIDILIILNNSTETSNHYRTLLRPRFCIAATDQKNELPIRNFVKINNQCSTLELIIDKNKIIKSVQKVCK